ncbi:GTPase IMAP family member 4-like [Spinachia spinachia]
MECQCENNSEDAVTGWWMSGNTSQMGAFTVVGYLLYRFSQTLPALIRWPIRLFCSLTGLSSLWSWVSHLVGTLRGIQSLCKFVSRSWRFVEASYSKLKGLVAVHIGSPADDPEIDRTNRTALRLIVLGPRGGGRTSLGDTLLGDSKKTAPVGPLKESTSRRSVVGGTEVTVIDTPDLLGPSLGINDRAREALRSLQLSSPGPHAFLLVTPAGGSTRGVDQEMAQAMHSTLELFGDGVAGYIIPVLTHAERPRQRDTEDWGPNVDLEALERARSLCDQKTELVDNGPDCPPEAKNKTRRQLLGRVREGHFVHELQRREDHIREKLLADMSSVLAGKLGHM